jgi:hypothetical protein
MDGAVSPKLATWLKTETIPASSSETAGGRAASAKLATSAWMFWASSETEGASAVSASEAGDERMYTVSVIGV